MFHSYKTSLKSLYIKKLKLARVEGSPLTLIWWDHQLRKLYCYILQALIVLLQGRVSMGCPPLLFELLKPTEHWAKNLYMPAKISNGNLEVNGKIAV